MGLTIHFKDVSTPGSGATAIVDWDWDLGDGNTSTEEEFDHTYAGPDTYQVFLNITDDNGGTDSIGHTVIVTADDPPAPPPPSSEGLLFDGRATMLDELEGHEVTSSDPYTHHIGTKYYYLHETPIDSYGPDSPAYESWTCRLHGVEPLVWSARTFIKDDISIESDARYTKRYKIDLEIGDSSPWLTNFLTDRKAGAQITKRRTLSLETIDYYAMAVKVPSWMDPKPEWADILSLGYQTAANDQFAFSMKYGSDSALWYNIASNAGYGNDPTTNPRGTTFYNQTFKKVVFNRWEEWVFVIKWSTHKTGFVQVYNKVPGVSDWTKVFEKLNIDTQFYGTSPYGTFPQNGDRGIIDKMGMYYGRANAGNHQTLYESGLVRAESLAAAKASFPS